MAKNYIISGKEDPQCWLPGMKPMHMPIGQEAESTEAEWEYAAKGKQIKGYQYGSNATEVGWVAENEDSTFHAVETQAQRTGALWHDRQ